MKTQLKTVSLVTLGLALVSLGGSKLALAPAGDAGSYRFQKAPVNAMGLASLAELRGKPILIDFWGTR